MVGRREASLEVCIAVAMISRVLGMQYGIGSVVEMHQKFMLVDCKTFVLSFVLNLSKKPPHDHSASCDSYDATPTTLSSKHCFQRNVLSNIRIRITASLRQYFEHAVHLSPCLSLQIKRHHTPRNLNFSSHFTLDRKHSKEQQPPQPGQSLTAPLNSFRPFEPQRS